MEAEEGAIYPVLSHTLPVYLPQIPPGIQIAQDQIWLSLQSHATDFRSKINNSNTKTRTPVLTYQGFQV